VSSLYDFNENPRAWQFTGELKKVKIPNRFFGYHIAYQWVFEKTLETSEVVRIGIMIDNGRVSISDPPAGEGCNAGPRSATEGEDIPREQDEGS
jgi:hypothetical protein